MQLTPQPLKGHTAESPEQDTDLKSTPSPQGPGLKEVDRMQALAETECSQPSPVQAHPGAWAAWP